MGTFPSNPMDTTNYEERPMTYNFELLKYGIDHRKAIHLTLDKSLLEEVDRFIPTRKRSAFMESLIRSELNEMKRAK